MRAAEGRKEVVENIFVGQVDDRKAQAHLVAVAIQQVVMADGQIEQVTGLNALRIVVVVFGIWGRVFSLGWT